MHEKLKKIKTSMKSRR